MANGFSAQFVRSFEPAAQRAQQQAQHRERMALKRRLTRAQIRQINASIETQQERTDIQRERVGLEGERLGLQRERQETLLPLQERATQQRLETGAIEQERARSELDFYNRTMDERERAAQLQNRATETQIEQTRHSMQPFRFSEGFAEEIGAEGLAGEEIPRETAAAAISGFLQRQLARAARDEEDEDGLQPLPPRESLFGTSGESPVGEAPGFTDQLVQASSTQGSWINVFQQALRGAAEGLSTSPELTSENRQQTRQVLETARQRLNAVREASPRQRTRDARLIIGELNQLGQQLSQRDLSSDDEELLGEIQRLQQFAVDVMPEEQNPNRPVNRLQNRALQALEEGETEEVKNLIQLINAMK